MYFSKLQSKAVGLPCVLTDFLKRNGLLMWHEWHGGLYWWNFPHWRPIFYCILKCKVLVCWSSLNSIRVLVIVLVGNVLVLVLVLGTSVLETSMPIINPNPNLNVIACSNVMIYRQSILYTQAAVIKQQI